MKIKTLTRIAAILLILHGFIEVMGLFAMFAPEGMPTMPFENFGGMDKADIAANMGPIAILGLMWGITRLIAAWGIWRMKKWAVVLGCIVSVVSLIASISIIPAGVMDTLLAAPVLILLLQAWFGNAKLEA